MTRYRQLTKHGHAQDAIAGWDLITLPAGPGKTVITVLSRGPEPGDTSVDVIAAPIPFHGDFIVVEP